jgi:formate dehydrogenase subunit delta
MHPEIRARIARRNEELGMDRHHLASMANEIGEFFESASDHDEAVAAIAQHLKSFWEPRMRREIIAYAAVGGDELTPIVREAVLTLAVPAENR